MYIMHLLLSAISHSRHIDSPSLIITCIIDLTYILYLTSFYVVYALCFFSFIFLFVSLIIVIILYGPCAELKMFNTQDTRIVVDALLQIQE